MARLTPPKKRRRIIGAVAGTLSIALLVTLAVISSGFDARETPREEASIWVERSAGQFARVNTETAEIDTVRVADNPSGMVQTGALGVLLTQGFGEAWVLDPVNPQDVQKGQGESESASGSENEGSAAVPNSAMRTPEGTQQVIAAGRNVIFFTEKGEVFVSHVVAADSSQSPTTQTANTTSQTLSTANQALTLTAPARLELQGTPETSTQQRLLVTAVALDETGRLALYSASESVIRWADASTGVIEETVAQVPVEIGETSAQLAIIGGKWVLFDSETGTLVIEDVEQPITLDTRGTTLLQASSSSVDVTNVLVADEGGLWQIDINGSTPERIVQTSGVPAQPRPVGDDMVAAFMSADSALMWRRSAGETQLIFDEAAPRSGERELEIRSNGAHGVIIDRTTGMMWRVSDGKLISVEQWSLVNQPKQEAGTVITQDVAEQEPPVAVDDSFGVRAGAPAQLPVLLNDYDPNRKDVLTIVTEGVGADLPADFGAVLSLTDNQELVLNTNAAASGSATFTYRITDGVNISEPATVTLRVVPEDQNSAPEWCGVDACQRAWPSPEMTPGGTLLLPILEGWVDPDGDPMVLLGATVAEGAQVRALITDGGRLAVRHTDPNAPDGEALITVTVEDAQGASTERELRIRIRAGALIEFHASASTVRVGETTGVKVLDRVTGGSGSFQLVSATVQQGTLQATANQSTGSVDLLASEAQSALVAVIVRDTVTSEETTGLLRVTSIENRETLALPPLTAFVRPLADTTVDILAAVPGANARALTVRSAVVHDGQLRADVIEHARVRLSGSTPDGQPGRIGSIDVVVTEGSQSTTTRLTVFQVAEVASGAIAVSDTATVRAGSVVDIAVLDNDIAPPGERLVLSPEIGSPGIDGELAFASGSVVRYLAPKTPGTYTLSYTTYGASSPEVSDVGQVRVTVLPTGANRDPQPQLVTIRVSPGSQARVTIPLSEVDPDGDRLRLVSVDTPSDPQVVTTLMPRSNAIQVHASETASRETLAVDYVVRDPFGGEATGKLRIIVTDPDPGGLAPVVYSDYVRIAKLATEPAVVRPLDNDIDPSGGTLELLSVVPNLPAGSSPERVAELNSRLDLTDLDDGVVRVSGGDIGTVSFIYKVKSTETQSTTEGLIVVQVSERVGVQAPTVSDTVLSVKDRADFSRVGVDVVTDRVRWASGDTGTLTLSLYDNNRSGYSVSGNNIRGTYRAEGDLVTFKLSGVDITGETVESFGFLIVPPLDELRLTLKPDAAAVSVNENKTVEFDVSTLVDLGQGDEIELGGSTFTVQRPQASCTLVAGTTVKYSAGREGPWSDTCAVRVRLTEQRSYTLLQIPINIVPDDPVAQLKPLTRTISPGESETITLTDMLEWQGGRAGSPTQLTWQVTGSPSGFEITNTGATLTAVARADAVPGSQATLTVKVSGYGQSEAALTLRVGEAAVNAPRGATIALKCTVGDSCTTPLVGVAGEFDPFAGKTGGGLTVVSVDAAACTTGDLAVSGDNLVVTWPDNRGPGGKCTASYTVRDAQNRTGTGIIEFDAQGVPRAPASISLVAYDRSSITLEVVLGEAASAHPATTGVVLTSGEGSSVGSCEPSGATYRCVVNGLTVGERATYSARAVNDVGESDPTLNSVTAWAYEPPVLNANQISIEQVSAESASTATVRVRVEQNDGNVERIVVTVGGVTGTITGSAGSVTISGVSPGENVMYQAQPISRYAPPTGGGGQGEKSPQQFIDVIGLPQLSDSPPSSDSGSNVVQVNFTVFPNFDNPSNVFWGASGEGETCEPSNSGLVANTTLIAPAAYQSFQVTICAKNSFGTTQQTETVWVGGKPPQLTKVEYIIDPEPKVEGNVVRYQLQGYPTVTGTAPRAVVSFSPGGSTLVLDASVVKAVTATQCVEEHCSDASAPATFVNAPTIVELQPSGVCYKASKPPAELADLLTISAAAQPFAQVEKVDGSETDSQITLRVSWNGDFSGLKPVEKPVCYEP